MNALEKYAAALTTQAIIDAILHTDQTLNTVDRVSDEARTLREIRASLYSTLEARFPHVEAVLEDWAMNVEDERTYTEVLLDAVRQAA